MSAEADAAGPDSFVIVGRVRKAHGLDGEVIVESLTDAPDTVFSTGRRVLAGTVTGRVDSRVGDMKILGVRPHGAGLRIAFDAIPDRTEAEKWRERYLLLPADEIEPLEEGEVYLHELPGMRVQLVSGEEIGPVVGHYQLPQGIMLEVSRSKGSVLIPYEQTVVSVDREARLITVDPPEGLLD